ncbi:unknown [Hungatella hathewayi CAG:224]|nr:unknown [Hungatella hathewayi CAG:224]
MPGGVSSYISYNISYNFLTASMNFFIEQWLIGINQAIWNAPYPMLSSCKI